MDMVKIGKFIADLRRENNITQEQLGTELGVTNKTVSRWETGTYLPPVEMLQALSDKFNVSINEILSGEKITSVEDYKQQAESNIKTVLGKSVFTMRDKERYFSKKWLKDHCIELVIEICVLIAMAVLGAIFYATATYAVSIICLVWAMFTNNRKRAYVERKLCENNDEQLKENKQLK
ncbi:MAG: helix-turn-helix domain-containing protein [Corallococcus sp.]|nr:helix-turn-helix domain-containing protein [Corallococcus sp.]